MLLPSLRALAACALLVPVAAFAANATAPRPPAEISTQLCAGCHGPNLTGGIAPNLLDDTWKHGSDDASILRSIAVGFPATGMAGFANQMSEAEQKEFVAYLRRRARAFALGGVPASVTPPTSLELKSEKHAFRLETVTTGLETPWGIVFLPDRSLVVSDRVGKLWAIAADGKLNPEPVKNSPKTFVKQDGGYLDLIAHPDYAKNGWLYLAYVELGEKPETSMTVIVRGRIENHTWTDEKVIFRAPQKYYYKDTSHYGCRFLFDPQGNLFFTLGERGNAIESQDLSSPLGKIHRVTADGEPAPGNPFLDRKDVWPSIWTYGNRHPQGLQYHPVTGKLWATEHGPKGGDELNRIEPGRNYGWPTISHGEVQFREVIEGKERAGMEQPIVHWSPPIAPAAIEFYKADKFPRWKNSLFMGCLVGQRLVRIETEGDKVTHQEILFKDQGRVRDVVTGPDGCIYVALNNPGRIARLVPSE